jgi:hypothetical protein
MDMPTTDPQRCFRLTPGHCLLALLAVEFLLFLSQLFRWLPKGWPVLIAIASVGAVVLAMLVWLAVALVFGRRFQFSLRSLLMLVVVVALPCSWYATEVHRVAARKAFAQSQRHVQVTVPDLIVGGNWSLTSPSEDEMMSALEQVRPSTDNFPPYTVERVKVRIIIEPVGESVDPPQEHAEFGRVQVHHFEYKCTFYFTEITRFAWFYSELDEDGREIAYISKDFLQAAGS